MVIEVLPRATIVSAVGGSKTAIAVRVVQVVGPASYATNGFAVNASAFFRTIIAAKCIRQFVTATGVSPTTFVTVNPSERTTNVYSSGKFLALLAEFSATPAGTNNAPVFTGAAIGGAHSCAIATCDQSHPNSTTVAAGTVAAPVFTGTPFANKPQELAALDNLAATLTFEFLIWGVPT